MHPDNRHRNGYDFDTLCKAHPALSQYIVTRKDGEPSIDFSNADALRVLNAALLLHHYQLKIWDLPAGFLCPPVPGRADYLHHLHDLIKKSANADIHSNKVRVFDIGTGASLIYPILGAKLFDWQFVASDIDSKSVKLAKQLAMLNGLKVKVLQQKNTNAYFDGIIKGQDKFLASMCNPPFHGDEAQAQAGSARKWKNLKGEQSNALNFGGRANELWCDGGERGFISRMIEESQEFAEQVLYFTSLVSNKDNLRPLKQQLKAQGAQHVEVVAMNQGQKQSRFIAWSFMDAAQRQQFCQQVLASGR